MSTKISNDFNKHIADCKTEAEHVFGLPSCSSDSMVEIPHRTNAVIRGLALIMVHHGASCEIIALMSSSLRNHLDTFTAEDVWLKHIKYILTYPLAKYLRNELPSPPSDSAPWQPSGPLKQWMSRRLMCYNNQNTHLWYSWFQAKRSSLPASDEIVQATYDKHLATLTKVDPGLENKKTVSRILNNKLFNEVLESISKEVSKTLRTTPVFEEHTPSRSASFEKTRKEMGSFGFLREAAEIDYILSPSELEKMVFVPRLFSSKSLAYEANVVVEVRAPSGREDWSSLRHHIESIDLSANLNCTIQGILEPMKVRVISKGNAVPYYSCKPLQKALHGAIRHLPPFRLTGKTFCPTDMIDLYQKVRPTDEWFSIDYSAATDGLSWQYAGAIFAQVIRRLPHWQQALALKVLGPHNLHYPVEIGRPCIQFKGVMTNGQLMGSVLSFPILCLANLGVYLDVTEQSQADWTAEERLNHVLVNGDDMVYAADPSLWPTHCSVAGQVGLEMTVGKAYRHRSYANINSTSVNYNIQSCERTDFNPETPYQIDYLNTGLFFGQRKIQGNSEEGKQILTKESNLVETDVLEGMLRKIGLSLADDKYLCTSLPKLLEGARPGRGRSILKQFLTLHKDTIRREQTAVYKVHGKANLFSRNLFLPISMGGFGVPIPNKNWKWKVKPIQVAVIKKIISQNGLTVNFSRPIRGFEPIGIDGEVTSPWVLKEADVQIFGRSGVRVSDSCGRFRNVPGIYFSMESSAGRVMSV
jgi:hypothetical protein